MTFVRDCAGELHDFGINHLTRHHPRICWAKEEDEEGGEAVAEFLGFQDNIKYGRPGLGLLFNSFDDDRKHIFSFIIDFR